MGDEKGDRSGGFNFDNSQVSNQGDMVGRDQEKIVNAAQYTDFKSALEPVATAIETGSPEVQVAAKQQLAELEKEVAKGDAADDGLVATLVEGIVGLVPGAVSAVVAAFGTPLLSAAAGPLTKSLVERIAAHYRS